MNQGHRQEQLEEVLRKAVQDFASSITSSGNVVADMSEIIKLTRTLPLSNLSYWEHFIRGEFTVSVRDDTRTRRKGWRTLFGFTPPQEHAASNRFLTWFDLSNWDGHVRERTLHTLVGPAPNAFFLALAAQRLNDWVPQVREAARKAVPLLASTSDPEHVVDVLCALLPIWTSWGRLGAADRQVMSELVALQKVVDSLVRRLIVSAAGPMPAVLSQALRASTLDEYLAAIATQAVQPAVRAKAYQALIIGKAIWVEGRQWQWTDVRYCKGRWANVLGERALGVSRLMESLISAAADRSPIVRRVAAEALIREVSALGDAVLPLARQFANDSSPAVAERGVFVLKKFGA